MNSYPASAEQPWAGYRSDILKVELEAGVTKIGSFAFAYFTKLTEMTIPDGVTIIDALSFQSCSSLTEVTIADSVTQIGLMAFQGCSGLTEVTIPDSVTKIGDNAFQGCSRLTDVAIGAGVTSIGSYAFSYCGRLSNIRYAGSRAQWESIDIGSNNDPLVNASIRFCVGSGACGDNLTWSLYEIENGEYNLSIEGMGDMYDYSIKDDQISPASPWNEYYLDIAAVEIENGITRIGNYAFSRHSKLKNVTMPNTVKSIGCNAFSGCNGVKDVSLPTGLTSIEAGAFCGCDLFAAIIPDGVTSIEQEAFDGNMHLSDVILPQGLLNIGESAFSECRALTDIMIPESVASVGRWAFADCDSLARVDFEGDDIVFGEEVFRSCYNVVIYCKTGSDAMTYAKNNGIPYRLTDPAKPVIKSVTNMENGTSIKWAQSESAEGYYIYRNGTKIKTITSGSTLSYLDTETKNNTKYIYNMIAYYTVAEETYQSPVSDKAIHYFLSVPTISNIVNISTGVKLTWGEVDGATGYYLYRGSTRIKTLTGTTYTDTAAANNTKYTYKLYAYKTIDGKTYRSAVSAEKMIYYISRPSLSAVESVSTGVKLTWPEIAGASGYYVYRDSTRIKAIGSGTTLTYTDTASTTDGTKYTYKIYAFKKVDGVIYKSTVSATKFTYFMSRPVISSATNSAASTLTVTWGKNAKANGYQVKYVLGDTEKTVTISSGSTVTRKITGLTKGKSYKVYVRSFKTVSDKKYFSTWSAYKTVKITK